MPSICSQKATVGLHLTVPGMRILQLNDSLMFSKQPEMLQILKKLFSTWLFGSKS